MGGSEKIKEYFANTLPGNPASIDFTFSIWIYVDNWQYRYSKPKVIFRRSNSKTNTLSPSVALAPSTNDLDISLTTFSSTSNSNVDNWSIQNIPIQKWCNIIISTNNRTVDTYVDGKLVNTHVLSGVPKMDKNANIELTPDGGFSGADLSLDTFPEQLVLAKHMRFTEKDLWKCINRFTQ